jgi:hypothetical protein
MTVFGGPFFALGAVLGLTGLSLGVGAAVAALFTRLAAPAGATGPKPDA